MLLANNLLADCIDLVFILLEGLLSADSSEAYNALNKRVYNLILKCTSDLPYTYYAQQVNAKIKDIIEEHKSVYKLLGKDMPENLANFNMEKYLEIKKLLV